jgi:hypothetical protein
MVRGMRSGSRDTTDLLRGAGGVLLAAGCVALFARKAGGQHPWSGFALLLLVLIPAVVLYTLALTGANRGLGGGGESWRSVLMVVAILLGPVVLAQTLEVLGADTNTALYDAAIFALTALIAAYGASRARVPYAVLLAALSLLVAWLIVWGQILNHPSADTFRILLIAGAALLFVAATALERAKGIGSSEVATAGGVAAVAAGVVGVFVGTIEGIMRPFTGILTSAHTSGPHSFGFPHPSGLQNFGWDLYLLVLSLALILVGSRVRSRGLGYVGGFGALMFVYSIALEVTRIESDRAHTSSLVGWPLALLVLGAVGLAAPVFAHRET